MNAIYWVLRNWKIVGTGLAIVVLLIWLQSITDGFFEAGKKQGLAECKAKILRAQEQQREIDHQNAEVYEAYRASSQAAKSAGEEVGDGVPDDPTCRVDDAGFRLLNDALSGEAFEPSYPSESGSEMP